MVVHRLIIGLSMFLLKPNSGDQLCMTCYIILNYPMNLLQALEPPQPDAVTSAVSTLREVFFVPLDDHPVMHVIVVGMSMILLHQRHAREDSKVECAGRSSKR